MSGPRTQPRRVAWVTGANGLIGNALAEASARLAPRWHVLRFTRELVDLADFAEVERMFHSDQPQLIIHCAAISRSPLCQQEPALARQVNVEVTAHLANLAHDTPFVFFSSDLVFDGRKGAYVETDPVNPLSVYAESKTEAEAIVLRNPLHTVLRTSLTGGRSPTGDRGFNEQMRLAWMEGRKLRLFTDEFRCPMPAAVTARAVWRLVGLGATGLYHLAGAERMSRFELGQLVAARWPSLHPQIEAGSIHDYQGAARPADCSLDCAKVQALLPFRLPGLREWLRTHHDEQF